VPPIRSINPRSGISSLFAAQGLISPRNAFVEPTGEPTPVSFRFLESIFNAVGDLQINGVPGPPGPAGPQGPQGVPGPTGSYQAGQGININTGTTPATISTAVAYLPLQQTGVTVSALPAAGTNRGSRAFVTDATATSFYSIVAGTGTNFVPVFSDGTNWRIG